MTPAFHITRGGVGKKMTKKRISVMCWVPLGGWVGSSHHCWFAAYKAMFSQTSINEREWQLQQILHINIRFLRLGASKGWRGGRQAMENGSSQQNCLPQPSPVSRCSNIQCLERFWYPVLFLASSGSSFQSLKHFWRAQSSLQGMAWGNCETPAQQEDQPHPSPCSTQDVSNDAVC